MGKLSGKIAVVTGGNSGIGFATAKQFVDEGAYVFITGRRQEQLDRAKNELGDQVTAVKGDVSNLEDLDRLFQVIKDSKGRLDIVVANAGGAELAPIGSITVDQFDRTFNINVRGVLFTVQKALPLLTDGGSIIITGSIAGSKGLPGMTVYSATKAAVRSFVRTWTLELKDRHIRANVISPGPIKTAGVDALPQEMMDQIIATVPMGRIGTVDEIASVAVFLASDESSYITGTELFVDGGTAQV